MKAQAGTPFFSEISSPFPDTVSASLRSACRSLAVCRHCARYLLLRYRQSPYKSVLFSEIPGYFFSDLKELFLTQPVCLQSCILFLSLISTFSGYPLNNAPAVFPCPKSCMGASMLFMPVSFSDNRSRKFPLACSPGTSHV